jgi:serine/threonine-protein kinase
MSDDWYGAKSGPGERWNVNLPALIGVVFVFLLGVIVWVIVDARSAGDDGGTARPGLTGSTLGVPPPVSPASTAAITVPITVAPATIPTASTSPIPLPVTSPPPVATTLPTAPVATAAPTSPPAPAPTVAATVVVLPTAPPESGDLGVPGHPIQRPPCDGGYITIIGASIGGDATAAGLDAFLDRYPGSNYLRTDLTCPSLTQSKDGQPIYVAYLGPFVLDSDACAARAKGPSGSYVRRLSNDLTPAHGVTCA